MNKKTIIVTKFDPVLEVESEIVFIDVVIDGNNPPVEVDVKVNYNDLAADEKLKIDDALTVLEAKIV